MSITDYADWNEPAAHAAAIATVGVPLLSSPNTLLNQIGVSIPAGGFQQFVGLPFTQIGYAVQMIVEFPVAATNPFVELRLTWSDPVSAAVYDEAHYFIAGSGSGVSGWTTLGNGPARSSQLTAEVTNLDPAQAVTVTIQVAQDSCVRQADRWYWRNNANIGLGVPGFNLAQQIDDEDVLGIMHNSVIPASGSLKLLCGMAPGRLAQLAGTLVTVAPSAITFQVQAVPSSVYTTASDVLYAVPAAATFGYQFLLPRAPVLLQVTNSSTVAGNIFAMMTAAE